MKYPLQQETDWRFRFQNERELHFFFIQSDTVEVRSGKCDLCIQVPPFVYIDPYIGQ